MAETFLQAVKEYLDKRAAEDELFAAKYIGSKKTVKQCCAYIMGQAKKRAQDGAACIEDKVVFGWAVHFYQEDDIKGPESPVTAAVSVGVGAGKPAGVKKAESKPKAAKKAKDFDDQPMLFTFDD